MDKIKLFELFAGYGGASFALNKAGIEFETVGFSEIDKYAIQCYKQNHGEIKNYGDITKINAKELPDFNFLTGGFPCQAFSQAGSQKGELDPRGTLFNDIIRIAEEKQPEYILLENVKGLTTKRFKDTFNKILSELNRINYNVYWKVLNSKEHGIPQNRERVWFVCFRKDIDKYDHLTNPFKFPPKEELKLFLKDILEDNPNYKYNLSEEQINKIKYSNFNQQKTRIQDGKVSQTILSRDYKDPKCIQVADYRNDEGLRIRKNGLSPCLSARRHSESDISTMPPFIIETNKNNQEVKSCALRTWPRNAVTEEQKKNRGKQLEIRKDEVANSITTHNLDSMIKFNDNLRIRKLTPKECFRLMGFLGDEINLDNLSDTQKYKLAGNGWEINVVSKIIKEMLK